MSMASLIHRPPRTALCCALVFCLAIGSASLAVAGPREQAKRMHDRLAGVPPSAAVLDEMESLINGGNAIGAAELAMENDAFYSVTLKNFATPWTNREQSVFEPLNDYTATVIGLVRDGADFRRMLYDDVVYVGTEPGAPPYSPTNNAHYEWLEEQGIDLQTSLDAVAQSSLTTGLPPAATAGVMTTRAAAQAFFVAGTNRAMLRFTLLNHLCRDMEQLQDSTRSPDRIRQDVSRSPGGDSRLFMNNCISCHNGMDPLAQAYAYYNFDQALGRIVYNDVGTTDPATGTRVQAKYHINADTFRYGYVTPDDSWVNYWRNGPNALLGWDTTLPEAGAGAKSLGIELANSEAFAACQVRKVFRAVCLRAPTSNLDHGQVATMTASFQANGYRVKQVFAEAATYCMGD